MGSDADFSPLGDIEFENAAALFEFCELGRRVASNSGLIVMQGAYDIQQALATIYERANDHVRRRFSLLSKPPEQPAQAQALRVAIAVVLRGDEVLLVCRRGDDSLSWQFPAGMCKPGSAVTSVAVQETHAETGVHCAVREELGSRVHPKTGVLASYVLCDYLAGEATNRDAVENTDVAWVPLTSVTRFIPTENIYPPILSALEAA